MRQRGNLFVFALPTIIAGWFVYTFAMSYLTADPAQFGIYRPRQHWLDVHILAGIAALLLGPAQLWLGLNRRTAIPHRVFGVLYVAGVAVSGTAAVYLALHTDFGWVFGLGLGLMACAWLISTAFATVAICRHMPEQHHEYMIRSYIITFAFVTFRFLNAVLDTAKVGTMVERMTASSWLAWVFPLMIAESILQGRKIFRRKIVSEAPLPDEKAYTDAPEPAEFDLQDSESTYQPQP